jgi:hypothetical protein
MPLSVKALRAEERGDGTEPIMDQQRSRAAATPTTTKHAPPTPGQAAEPEPVVTGCLYEAGFSTTGPHPQGGVAIARSIDDARQRLADMLIFCDPAAVAVADITAFTPTRGAAKVSPEPAMGRSGKRFRLTPGSPRAGRAVVSVRFDGAGSVRRVSLA